MWLKTFGSYCRGYVQCKQQLLGFLGLASDEGRGIYSTTKREILCWAGGWK